MIITKDITLTLGIDFNQTADALILSINERDVIELKRNPMINYLIENYPNAEIASIVKDILEKY